MIEKGLKGIKKNIFLKNYTSFRIGGKCKYFFIAKTKEDLIKAVLLAKKENVPFFILAGGSNLLVGDKGFNGLVIKIPSAVARPRAMQNTEILAEAGVKLVELVNISATNGFTGLEWAIGIPGTVGGAIFGNTGAFNHAIGESIKTVEVFDIKEKKVRVFKNKDCQFNYRQSLFQKKNNLIILSVVLKLKKGNKLEIKRRIKECLDYKKNTQPLNFPSAGSVFKNPCLAVGQAKGYSAGELIEKCGLKGKKIGGAKISEKHANFIINFKKAKAKDVIALITLVKNSVKNKFGIILEEETNRFGNF